MDSCPLSLFNIYRNNFDFQRINSSDLVFSSLVFDGEKLLCGIKKEGVMFDLLHVFCSISFGLLLFHLFCFLLLKIFGNLYLRAAFRVQIRDDTSSKRKCRDDNIKRFKTNRQKIKYVHWADESSNLNQKLQTNITTNQKEEKEGLLLWLSEAPFSKEDSLLEFQAKGEESKEKKPCLLLEDSDSFPIQESESESPCIKRDCDVLISDDFSPLDSDPIPVVSPHENIAFNGDINNQEEPLQSDEIFSEEPKFIKLEINSNENEERENNFLCGASSLTGESTSKSSIEWRSSLITKDSETEYPFSSSSRRSSSRWESYALFRKYDEEMLYFHRISSEKLTETESFRSIMYQPRSISERIYHKITTNRKNIPQEPKNAYRELENAYVAQVCLAWEALNWNYMNFMRKNPDPKEMGRSYCSARVAQEFQQFQVLIHRFIENEPFEFGKRPEVYARMKVHSPKLLLVPEFKEMEEGKEGEISAIEFLLILQDIIRTFMNFLKTDKQTACQKFKSLIKKKSGSVDYSHIQFLKKTNHKKKMRINDIVRQGKCVVKRRLVKVEEEMEILMGLIDLKVVSRVLRLPNISEEQLHWCEEKMTKVRVLHGKIQRELSPLFFPVH
ncbi:hypothetical protein LUZ60_009897 [Juncus effusus]|nr:hypothetical protein LUZ60_009897 [Juncus effusus]